VAAFREPGSRAFLLAIKRRLVAQLRYGRSAIVAIKDLVVWVVLSDEGRSATHYRWSVLGARYKSSADGPEGASAACEEAARALGRALNERDATRTASSGRRSRSVGTLPRRRVKPRTHAA
jgi:hypothetical protein